MGNFGENLKAIRVMRGLSQEQLAEILGTTKQVISRYETNQRTPKIDVATEYARKLNVPLQALNSNGNIFDLNKAENVGDRIKAKRQEQQYSVERLAEIAGVAPATIYRYEANEVKTPRSSVLRLIAGALQVDVYDLIGWDSVVIDDIKEVGRFGVGNTSIKATDYPVQDKCIPMFCCNETGMLNEDSFRDIVVCMDSRVLARCSFVARVYDDHMEPLLHEGDTVYVSAEDANDGDIVLVCRERRIMIRRMRRTQDGMILSSDNSAKYPPEVIPHAKEAEYKIIGTVIALTRYL